VRQDSPASAPQPELYMPLAQHPYFANELQVILRTGGQPETLAGAVRDKVGALDPQVAIKFTTLRAMVADSIATPRLRTFLVTVFAALALPLAMAGVYSLMSYLVTRRTAELGLRIALGAGAGDVLRAVLGRALWLAAAGLAAGIGLSLAGARILAGLLFGVQASDSATYAGVLLAVVVSTLLAAAVPAWRASRIDPAVALRQQ